MRASIGVVIAGASNRHKDTREVADIADGLEAAMRNPAALIAV